MSSFSVALSKIWNKFPQYFHFTNSKKPCSLGCNTVTRTYGDRWRARVREGKWILHAKPKRHWPLLIGSDETKPQSNGTRRIETALQTYTCLQWCFFNHPRACCCFFYLLQSTPDLSSRRTGVTCSHFLSTNELLLSLETCALLFWWSFIYSFMHSVMSYDRSIASFKASSSQNVI